MRYYIISYCIISYYIKGISASAAAPKKEKTKALARGAGREGALVLLGVY